MSKENLNFGEAVKKALNRPPSRPVTTVAGQIEEHRAFNDWFRREARRGELQEDVDTGEISVEEDQ